MHLPHKALEPQITCLACHLDCIAHIKDPHELNEALQISCMILLLVQELVQNACLLEIVSMPGNENQVISWRFGAWVKKMFRQSFFFLTYMAKKVEVVVWMTESSISVPTHYL
jgi:hypothetical protein